MALVTGALSFVAFALLTIPDRIGDAAAQGASAFKLGSHLSRTPANIGAAEPNGDFSEATIEAATPPPAARLASRGDDFPRRGFSPPLDRPAPMALPVPPPPPNISPPVEQPAPQAPPVPPPDPAAEIPPPAPTDAAPPVP